MSITTAVNWMDKYFVNDERRIIAILRRSILIMLGCIIMTVFTPPVGTFFGDFWELGEEIMKMVALFIGTPFAFLYTLTFSVFELFTYLNTSGELYEATGLYWNYVAARIFCIGLHFFYLSVQIWIFKISEPQLKGFGWFGICLGRMKGLTCGLMLHVLYNAYGAYYVAQWFL